jgi:hypothetical protein
LHFGLIRNDGSEKPIAQALAAFAREGREVLPPPAPIVEEAAYFSGFPDSVDDAYAHYLDVRAVTA